MRGVRLVNTPTEADKWMFEEIGPESEGCLWLDADECDLPDDCIDGEPRSIVFNVDDRVFVEDMETKLCPSDGTQYVTFEEFEKHL